MTNLIGIDYNCEDIARNEAYEDLFYLYCETMCKSAGYADAYEMMGDVIAVEYFPNATLHDLLKEWYETTRGKDISEGVRGYYRYKKGFLMTHGCGYSWEKDDIFDGDKAGFVQWLANKGMELVC